MFREQYAFGNLTTPTLTSNPLLSKLAVDSTFSTT
jgi:hypothetical protein